MQGSTNYRWKTRVPLLFNDPGKGEVFEIPAGEPCQLVSSVEEALARNIISQKDEMAVWAARTNLKRGYVLVLMRGVLRGVEADDIVDLR